MFCSVSVSVLTDVTLLNVLLHLRAGVDHPDAGRDEGAAIRHRHVHLRRRLSEQPPLLGLGFGGRDSEAVARGGDAVHADLADDDRAPVGLPRQRRPRSPQSRLWGRLQEGAVVKKGSHCPAAILSLSRGANFIRQYSQ